MLLYYINRSGGQTTINVPDDLVKRFKLRPGVVNRSFLHKMKMARREDIVNFIRYAWQDRAWVALLTQKVFDADIIARYT